MCTYGETHSHLLARVVKRVRGPENGCLTRNRLKNMFGRFYTARSVRGEMSIYKKFVSIVWNENV